MSNTLLRKLLREVITEAANDEDGGASAEAQQKGLQHLGWGRYGKDGKVTHMSKNGKLVPVQAPAQPTTPQQTPAQQAPVAAPKPDDSMKLSKMTPNAGTPPAPSPMAKVARANAAQAPATSATEHAIEATKGTLEDIAVDLDGSFSGDWSGERPPLRARHLWNVVNAAYLSLAGEPVQAFKEPTSQQLHMDDSDYDEDESSRNQENYDSFNARIQNAQQMLQRVGNTPEAQVAARYLDKAAKLTNTSNGFGIDY